MPIGSELKNKAMKNRLNFFLWLCLCLPAAGTETIDVTVFRHAGPYPVQTPFQVDSVDVNSQTFVLNRLLDTPLALDGVRQGETFTGPVLPGSESGCALHLLGFTLENTRYATATLHIDGLADYRLFVDGKQLDGNVLRLDPATHPVVLKYVSEPERTDTLNVRVEIPENGDIRLREDGKRIYTLADVLHGTHLGGAEISPDGRYLISTYRTTREGGQTDTSTRVTELADGRVLAERPEALHWMPRSGLYYYTREGLGGKQLVAVHPATGAETVLANRLPDGFFRFAPTEDYLLFTLTQEGPKENEEVYEVREPDDRQPGWRTRRSLARYDLASGLMQPLTFGYRNVRAVDVSRDGRYVLLMIGRSRLTQRPTTLFSLYRLDVQTLQADLLVEDDGFLSDACFSPDGTQVLLLGSPESLGGIGSRVKEGQTPSMTDEQLYLLGIADGKITPLTTDFNPSVQTAVWSEADGQVYFTAENRDCYSLYRLNPADGRIRQVDVPEEMVSSFSLAQHASVMAWYGHGASHSDRLYTLDTKTLKSSLLEDLGKERLQDVELGECTAWNFTNSRGDTLCGRYYLPPRFDPAKKYPLIVNYYGGCSPTSRNFESRYPHHVYAALGYVVYVVEPSGATGFGQEFSARHVNTAGEGVAQDIIEGTKQFCREHAFVDAEKIGCIGASYGGFMTQYLQTQTDLFAAAVSHAGISDHTSYWGEGYWGYSYSEVSMANSYPWSEPDLYVKQSPLYNADKIHTPLLFLHGDADTNVPVGESIQMFTALKLLGRETAFVAVKGENHHILDYDKRIRWQNTIFAWFAKWLQGDDTWWNALYPPKSL